MRAPARARASKPRCETALPTLAAAPLLLGLALLLFPVGCGLRGVPMTIEAPPMSESTRQIYAERHLSNARALIVEGRPDAALRETRRGLGLVPEHARLHRLRASLLAEQGRAEEAQQHRARADAIDPPLPALPEEPHPLSAAGAAPPAEAPRVAFVLLPPSQAILSSPSEAPRLPSKWPGEVSAALQKRLQTRFPGAAVHVVDPEAHPTGASIGAARSWLEALDAEAAVSLRVDRAFCGSSIKDGRFAIAWIRAAVARAGEEPDGPTPRVELVRDIIEDPPQQSCEAIATERALEKVLTGPTIEAAFAAAPSAPAEGSVARENSTAFSDESLRQLFPALPWLANQRVAQGRRYLSLGELGGAAEHFRRAAAIDPGHEAAAVFLEEAEASLALARAIGEGADEDAPATDSVGAHLSSHQRKAIEAQLAYEKQRRGELLSALAVLYELRSAPTPGTIANMRRAEIRNPSALGVALALTRVPTGGTVEARTLYAPDGAVIARYYFPEDSTVPILREDDVDRDGQPDRWVGYERGVVREVWETEPGGLSPNLHVVYGPGGDPIERIELDHNGDGRLDRLFVYMAGLLREESWDTNGDGAFDRFQEFDESGSLTMRAEDVDGDEEIDIRTEYSDGRITTREILNPKLLESY